MRISAPITIWPGRRGNQQTFGVAFAEHGAGDTQGCSRSGYVRTSRGGGGHDLRLARPGSCHDDSFIMLNVCKWWWSCWTSRGGGRWRRAERGAGVLEAGEQERTFDFFDQLVCTTFQICHAASNTWSNCNC